MLRSYPCVLDYDICMTVKSMVVTLRREEENVDIGSNPRPVSFLEVWRTGVRGRCLKREEGTCGRSRLMKQSTTPHAYCNSHMCIE
jgi:hypothetical protein